MVLSSRPDLSAHSAFIVQAHAALAWPSATAAVTAVHLLASVSISSGPEGLL